MTGTSASSPRTRAANRCASECGGVDVVRVATYGQAALGAALSLASCRSVASPGRLRRAARAEPDCRNRAPSPHAVAAADRLASQRSRPTLVGIVDLRPGAARAVSTRGLRHRVESRTSRPDRRSSSTRRRVVVVPFGIPLERYRQVDAAGRQRAARRWPPSLARASCSSAGSCTTKGSRCCSTPWNTAGGSLVIVGEGPLEGELRAVVTAERSDQPRLVPRPCRRRRSSGFVSGRRRVRAAVDRDGPRRSGSSRSRRWPPGSRSSAPTCRPACRG